VARDRLDRGKESLLLVEDCSKRSVGLRRNQYAGLHGFSDVSLAFFRIGKVKRSDELEKFRLGEDKRGRLL